MTFTNDLAFGFSSKLPLLLQTEAAECGLACLGMVAGYHKYRTDLRTLRGQFPISQKGARLADLIKIASNMDLATRA
ncbi:MAG: peptidase domain-containing ABC transporter, partial [Gammaproteobacteria bacterium]|nr:peptidase domain-containing ABC transporter [Gammaproteobacteria bacterium]